MGYWAFGDVLCQLWLSTDVLLCTASILNLCLISLDRYWSITRAISYLRKRTPRRAALMISVVWIASGVICFPPLAGWSRPAAGWSRPPAVISARPFFQDQDQDRHYQDKDHNHKPRDQHRRERP